MFDFFVDADAARDVGYRHLADNGWTRLHSITGRKVSLIKQSVGWMLPRYYTGKSTCADTPIVAPAVLIKLL